jgi:hypothetical protein
MIEFTIRFSGQMSSIKKLRIRTALEGIVDHLSDGRVSYVTCRSKKTDKDFYQ